MKICGLLPFAVLAWLLMVPPSLGGDKIDVNAPLSKWKSQATFDTEAKCKELRRHKLDPMPDPGETVTRLDRIEYLNSYCVADDDPRLKSQ